MNAVNLMPRDRRDGRSTIQASGIGVYVLLAGLAALVVCAAVWATANKQAGDREAKLQRVTAQAAAAEQRASSNGAYVEFERLARTRVQTVQRLSTTRFDWAHAMREIGRVLPADVWLTDLNGTSGGGSSAPTTTASAAPAPVITLQGCTRSQAKVARLLARLRTIDGVRKVALKSSQKPEAKGDTGCPANRESDPRFSIAISFAVPGAAADRVDSTGQVEERATAGTPAAGTAPPPRASQVESAANQVDSEDG
jgi:Tfp pilus assembly protein PilN